MQPIYFEDMHDKYELYSYGHAFNILVNEFEEEWTDILAALSEFFITKNDILVGGGNKSSIPKRLEQVLYPLGWKEIRIVGDLTIRQFVRSGEKPIDENNGTQFDTSTINGFVDGHNIDFIKGKVAFDLEWNSKDQTFDRDLLAMRTYFDCGIIDVGIILTRAIELRDIFKELDIVQKYGASTTQMGKLLPRLESRRQGGCPILAIGIRKGCIQ